MGRGRGGDGRGGEASENLHCNVRINLYHAFKKVYGRVEVKFEIVNYIMQVIIVTELICFDTILLDTL